MMDIVERLNAYNPPHMVGDEMMQEIAIDIQDAKAEIERLREALQKIADGERYQEDGSQYHVGYWGDFARAALQQKDSE